MQQVTSVSIKVLLFCDKIQAVLLHVTLNDTHYKPIQYNSNWTVKYTWRKFNKFLMKKETKSHSTYGFVLFIVFFLNDVTNGGNTQVNEWDSVSPHTLHNFILL